MWNTKNLKEQLQNLLIQYPQISIIEADSTNIIRLKGVLSVNRSAFDYTLQKDYLIEILIPVLDAELPQIKSLDNAIDKTYPHYYIESGMLCLETDTAVKFRFIEGFNLIEWMSEYVETYFFSYEYYCRFGSFPFGERSHSYLGIIETYQDIFNETDLAKTVKLFKYAATQKYTGHEECPCGSGCRLRKCHGPVLFPYMSDLRKKRIIQTDLENIQREIIAYESKMRDSKKTK